MEFVALFAGLLLPWLAGALGLAFIESRFGRAPHPNRFRQAGYGFFLGYGVLVIFVLLCNTWFAQIYWSWIMIAFVLLAVCSGLLLSRGSGNTAMNPAAGYGPFGARQWLLLALATATGLHLSLAAIDVLSMPVYPWDAWLAWVYRAKAWFFTGGMADIVDPAGWAVATSTRVFTIDAANYPVLPSVIPFWAALSLGRWSDTLINFPTLLAATAIGLGLYGQCRESGMSRLVSVAACYLLFSIPLFGTHIALAGYADLWMAGFTGLGFIALIRGAIAGQGFQTGLGFLMLALAMLTKNEGVVWFLAALLMQALTSFSWRTSVLVGFATAVSIWAASAMGVTHVDIPLIGILGVVDGQLQIPFIGRFALEVHDIWLPYRDNFFAMGSWNLLWVLVGFSLLFALAGIKPMEDPARRVGAVFIGVFLATQLFIFVFTDQGIWADTYTAINRLPLHFVPALIYAAVAILCSRASQSGMRTAHPVKSGG